MKKVRDLRFVGFSEPSTAEMRNYYKKDKLIISSLDDLESLRKRISESDDIAFKKPLWEEIKTIKKVVKTAQHAFFNALKTLKIVVVGPNRGGLLTEHPNERAFSLTKGVAVFVPVHQARQLIKEGVAEEAK